jgi:predicted unusual protein kinase regulating ubiquinone biosynthesis (AarF/ABC1/UbiB family)
MMTSDRASEPAAAGLIATFAEVAGAVAALATDMGCNVVELADDAVADAIAVARECSGLWDAVWERAVAVVRVVRAAPRFTRVAGELLGIVAAYRWHAAVSRPRAELLGAAAAAAALEALHVRCAERLYALCVDLRGGVLKLGQFAASRVDLLPDAYVSALSRLQDRVPAVPLAAIADRMADEFGMSPEALFDRFTDEPIAAASLAQVHAAELPDGTPVVVKVQVPGIETIVETDLAALQAIAPALRELLPFLDIETVAAELTRAVRAELDYVAEADHAAAFARCFAGDPDIVVPRVHPDRSSRRVLVLDRVCGERLLDYLDACEQRGEGGARDLDRLFAILIRTYCAQVLEHGLLHADPHPGNFLVLPGDAGPRLALLDFGCVQPYAAARRRTYAELCLAVLAADGARMASLFEAAGFRSRDGGSEGLRAFADLLLEVFRADAMFAGQDVDERAAVERVLSLTRDNPIVAIPGDFVLLGRVFAVLGGLLMRYRPRINLFQLLMPHLLRAARADDLA